MMGRLDVVTAVGIGGAAGCVARYLLSSAIAARLGTTFPAATMIVNVAGCFAIGVFMYLSLNLPQVTPTGRALLTTGFCGGFTTFSTFTFETMTTMEEGEFFRAGLYLVGSVAFGLIAVWLGRGVAGVAFRMMRGGNA